MIRPHLHAGVGLAYRFYLLTLTCEAYASPKRACAAAAAPATGPRESEFDCIPSKFVCEYVPPPSPERIHLCLICEYRQPTPLLPPPHGAAEEIDAHYIAAVD